MCARVYFKTSSNNIYILSITNKINSFEIKIMILKLWLCEALYVAVIFLNFQCNVENNKLLSIYLCMQKSIIFKYNYLKEFIT